MKTTTKVAKRFVKMKAAALAALAFAALASTPAMARDADNNKFDLVRSQVPNAAFGEAWYRPTDPYGEVWYRPTDPY